MCIEKLKEKKEGETEDDKDRRFWGPISFTVLLRLGSGSALSYVGHPCVLTTAPVKHPRLVVHWVLLLAIQKPI